MNLFGGRGSRGGSSDLLEADPAEAAVQEIELVANEPVESVESVDGLSIVVPTADPAAPSAIVGPDSLDDGLGASELDLRTEQPAGVSGEMIDWFLNPDGPTPTPLVPPDAEVSTDVIDPEQVLGAPVAPAAPSGLPERFDRPPLPAGLEELKAAAQFELSTHLGDYINSPTATEAQLHSLVIDALADFLSDQNTTGWTDDQLDQLADELIADILGHGPIQSLLDDPSVSEIMVNGTRAVFVERAGRLHKTSVRFASNEHVRRVIDLIVTRVGRRIDESSPMVDARLPDGSRVNAIISPLSVDGPMLTIRKFSKKLVTAQDIVAYETLSWESIALLRAAVYGRLNVLISGGTGTGKTTLLNVCSGFIPESERVVTIEDSVELRLNQEHVIRLEARPANLEGSGAVSIRDLVRNSLRMRPDRIVVGEVRGGEAIDMLQAMNTGHEGSLTTLHANSPRDALARLETMVLMGGVDLPVRAIREQITSAIDMIVHLDRLRDGSRRVTKITDVVGMEGDTITTSDIFEIDVRGVDEHGRTVASLVPTGLRPIWTDKLERQGIELRASTFGRIDVDVLAP